MPNYGLRLWALLLSNRPTLTNTERLLNIDVGRFDFEWPTQAAN